MKENFFYRQIEPRDQKLRNYIKLYYVQNSSDPNFYQKLTYFPNFTTTLNVYRNSHVEWNEYSRTHTRGQENLFLLVGKLNRSREIITKGSFNKLTIVFHPLGINHFIRIPLSEIVQEHFSFFDCGEEFRSLAGNLFDYQSLAEKRDKLDAFFLEKFQVLNFSNLEKAVSRIHTSKGQVSVRMLSSELGVSRKTLFRWFKRHLDYSPTEYSSIVKFRYALAQYQQKRVKPRFSHLAYESNYYDQSDLNAHFKVKTGLTPGQLFASLSTIEEDLYWAIE